MEHFRVVKVVQPAMVSLGVLLPHTTPGLARSCQVFADRRVMCSAEGIPHCGIPPLDTDAI